MIWYLERNVGKRNISRVWHHNYYCTLAMFHLQLVSGRKTGLCRWLSQRRVYKGSEGIVGDNLSVVCS